MEMLHLGKFYAPRRGGMETVLREQAEGLVERGCAVTVLVAGGAADRVEWTGGVRVVRAMTAGSLRSQPLAPTLVGLLRRELARCPDLVVLHLPHPLAAAAWSVATSLPGTARPPLAIWHHADITRQRYDGWLARAVQGRCLAAATFVGVSSRALAERSVELAPVRGRVRVIPFGIDLAPWRAVRAARRGPFLFVGRLVRYKGLQVLLQAAARVPAAGLEIVGDGPLAGDLARRITRLGLTERVRLRGDLPRAELLRAMSDARALVLPSLDSSETFGVVQLEAMAAGLPVIASDLPTGVREVGVADVTHRFVPAGDVAALAAALDAFLHDGDAVDRMGRAARDRAGRFDRGRMLDALLAAARDAVARRGR